MARGHAAAICLAAALLAANAPGRAIAPLPAHTGTTGVATTRTLPFFYDLYTFRADTGTAVVAAFAVDAAELVREPVDGGLRYRFDVTLVIADTAVRSVINRHDSVYVSMRRPLPRGHLLYTTIAVQAAPSNSTLHRVFMYDATTPGIGQLYTAPFPIPDYSGSDLMISDIALGQPDATHGWERGGVILALLPTGQFPASAFDVYYEIYNLPDDTPYTTSISIRHVDDDGVPGGRIVSLDFADEASVSGNAFIAELRRVETSLERGRYQVTVTVTDPVSRRAASRSRIFEVHARTGGATLVPAMPVANSNSRQ